ncbi:hypothetical protein U9K52_08670 [Chryseobacterium sp. MHB01]|uniref:hypothetical protein n=1 Tax=Chryseobacterium sp. MHB01 TaxID=3109433 RepID=UPI002B00395A|nr:hypothetical protein [Chryseobacterium sp. MHB01]MEA1848980.1 hypothetical protein [Chryseobacterium sp. MHB01]
MNYIKEINSFYDWLETNSVSDSVITLWHGLMHINNKTGWKVEFTVAISTLQVKTGLSSASIKRSRNVLAQLGRIKWKSRNGNLSSVYEMIPFAAHSEPQYEPQSEPQSEPQFEPQFEPQSVPQTVPQSEPQSVPINKLNYTKQNNNILFKKESKDENVISENDFDQHRIVDDFSIQEEIIEQEDPVLFPEENSKSSGQTISLENKPSKKVALKKVSSKKYFSAADFKNKLLELKVDEKDADDWINVRRQKRAVFTENVIKLIQDECERYSLEFSEAIKYSAKYSWQGFEYEWYLNKKNKENGKSAYNNSNNGFVNSAGNTSGGTVTPGKTSATTAIARQLKKLSSGNSESGDITIDAEIL